MNEVIQQLKKTRNKLQAQVDNGIICDFSRGLKKGRIIAYDHAIRKILKAEQHDL